MPQLHASLRRALERHERQERGQESASDYSEDDAPSKTTRDEQRDSWGVRRSAYYNADTSDKSDAADSGDENAAAAEEREARALQREQMGQLDRADLLGSDVDESDAESAAEAVATELGPSSLDSLTVTARAADPFAGLASLAAAAGGVAHDVAERQIPDAQLAEHVRVACPEFVTLARDVAERTPELHELRQTLRAWTRGPRGPGSGIMRLADELVHLGAMPQNQREGLDRAAEYVSLKVRLLAAFLQTATFCLALHVREYRRDAALAATPASVAARRRHPAAVAALKQRELLFKLEATAEGRRVGGGNVRAPTKPQLASHVSVLRQLVTDRASLVAAVAAARDPPPNESVGAALSDAESSEAELSGPEASEADLSEADLPAEGAFVPLRGKTAPVAADILAEDATFDETRQLGALDAIEKMQRQAASRFSVARGDGAQKRDAKRRAKQLALSGDGEAGLTYAQDEAPVDERPTRRDLEADRFSSDDDDEKSPAKRKRRPSVDNSHESEDGLEEEEEEDPLAMYEAYAAGRKQARADREAAVEAAKAAAAADEDEYDENDLGADGKRDVTFAMLKNKGLSARKKKIDRNPRLKRRKKFESAVKKLSSTRRVVKDRASLGAYRGEETGIRTTISRSVRL